jgi:hypothetical protein
MIFLSALLSQSLHLHSFFMQMSLYVHVDLSKPFSNLQMIRKTPENKKEPVFTDSLRVSFRRRGYG